MHIFGRLAFDGGGIITGPDVADTHSLTQTAIIPPPFPRQFELWLLPSRLYHGL